MCPATARMVAAVRTGRVQLCTGPGSTGPHSRCSRSAVARLLAEALLQVGDRHGAVAQALGAVLAAGQLDRRRQQHRLQRLPVGPLGLRQSQPHGAAVGAVAGQQVVVHLHDQLGAGSQRDADVVGHHPLTATGRPGADPVGVVEVPTGHAGDAGPAEAGVAVAGVLRVERARRGDVLGLDLGHDDVVDDRGVVGRDLHAADQLVGVEPRVDQEAPVVVGAGGRGCLRGVGGGQPDALEPLALAQRHVLDARPWSPRWREPPRARWRGCRRCAGRLGRSDPPPHPASSSARAAVTTGRRRRTRSG